MTLTNSFAPAGADSARHVAGLLASLGLDGPDVNGSLAVRSPVDGSLLAGLEPTTAADIDGVVSRAVQAFDAWRRVPAPARGELIRRFGDRVRMHKPALARLISLENGKIEQEALGEVQEVIDICDYAVGLSRQIGGRTLPSERPGHHLSEHWHPMGVFGLVSAFNFPAAVWSWGMAVSLVCGNSGIWKPSEKAPLTALAFAGLLDQAIAEDAQAPADLMQVVLGGAAIGRALAEHPDIAILSVTGSTAMGQDVLGRAGTRFARVICELGGNNAAIVTPSADLALALRAILFSAFGTAGQRCTTLRRLFLHQSIRATFTQRLIDAAQQMCIGHPLDPAVHIGPLIDERAFERMQAALDQARQQGGRVHGGERLAGLVGDGVYVLPAIVEMPAQTAIVREETFAPILYIMPYAELDEAVLLNNATPYGLSSSIFTQDIREAEYFQSALGSDCGIVNVNIGTSGAEIGGAFGGNKATGGGRVAGSDSWKNYMRRATSTVNFSGALPLAQGIRFELPE
ncbi:aldehyde dehydrogenase family protein [Sphingosinicella sp. LHD-64]|uniref:aldehyde dehydrogenase family protein n=1 Tax=Sphingosinicella sp. LHD-64 TaxID=3072139 RepID=UPI00281059DF|nr:aldehyde dehydrogenase family protein [Sphingosinicella sp. LHD-64]MDQ8757705.1 aldehyde dehydrogenase family protein [Sphingosinicella sp. LHD-64]